VKKPNANTRQVGGKHYQKPIQHWDFVIANGIPYMEAQVVKYVFRWREKNGVQDLEKARHFLDKLIETAEAEANVVELAETTPAPEAEARKIVLDLPPPTTPGQSPLLAGVLTGVARRLADLEGVAAVQQIVYHVYGAESLATVAPACRRELIDKLTLAVNASVARRAEAGLAVPDDFEGGSMRWCCQVCGQIVLAPSREAAAGLCESGVCSPKQE
jgi:hypothetical protein